MPNNENSSLLNPGKSNEKSEKAIRIALIPILAYLGGC